MNFSGSTGVAGASEPDEVLIIDFRRFVGVAGSLLPSPFRAAAAVAGGGTLLELECKLAIESFTFMTTEAGRVDGVEMGREVSPSLS